MYSVIPPHNTFWSNPHVGDPGAGLTTEERVVRSKKILQKSNTICSIAENGYEAVKMVKEAEYDLILMDVNMPKKNGIEATTEIRQFNADIPILALTAVEVTEMRKQIYESGMNDIIVKPYDINKFTQTLLKNLPQSGASQKNEHSLPRLRAV